jgi:hypothetical protein
MNITMEKERQTIDKVEERKERSDQKTGNRVGLRTTWEMFYDKIRGGERGRIGEQEVKDKCGGGGVPQARDYYTCFL